MPGVAILPPSPAFGGFGSSTYSVLYSFLQDHVSFIHHTIYIIEMQNGLVPPHRESVADIKAAAKEQAQRARGASATSLLRSARDQIKAAIAQEGEGDFKGALSSFTKAASLAAMFMDTHEFKQEMSTMKKGVLTVDFMNFQHVSEHGYGASCLVI